MWIYGSRLKWPLSKGDRRTEYDLVLEGLAANRIEAVDLRPAMVAVEPPGAAYYRHDSHWTPRGALATYDALLGANSIWIIQ